MIIVSELIIKLDEQPLSFSAAAAAAPHIFISTRWFREQIFAQYNTGEATERPQRVCFSFVWKVWRYLRNAAPPPPFHDTPIYFHRRCVTHKKVYHTASKCWGDEGMWVLTLTHSLAPSKFIICRRASSCPWSTPKWRNCSGANFAAPKVGLLIAFAGQSLNFSCLCGKLLKRSDGAIRLHAGLLT